MLKLYVIQALRIYPAFIMLKFKRMEVIVAGEHQRHVMTKLQYEAVSQQRNWTTGRPPVPLPGGHRNASDWLRRVPVAVPVGFTGVPVLCWDTA